MTVRIRDRQRHHRAKTGRRRAEGEPARAHHADEQPPRHGLPLPQRSRLDHGVRQRREPGIDPLYAPAHPFVRGIPWDTVLIVPLVAGGRTLGAISVYYLPEREPTGEETTFLGAVADQTAVVVENARLFTAAQGKAALEKRQKLARELHDSVSQALYGIALGSRTARTLLDRDPDRVADPLDYVLSLAEAGLAEMRALIFELRPESLENEG